jgi:wobble nucleotide-excising tRNase
VFTLGEKNVDTIKKIELLKKEIDELTEEIKRLNTNVQGRDGTGGKKDELASLEEEFKNRCWKQKQKHDKKFKSAFEGYRNSAEKFKKKVLQEWASNRATLKNLAYLEKKAETVFGPTPIFESTIPTIDSNAILTYESAPILKKRVIGKEDVDIAAMIKKLGNSDWVKLGIPYWEANNKVCPFCQRPTSEAFAQSLREFFDETFKADTKAIDDLYRNYKLESKRLQQQVQSIIDNPSSFLESEKFKKEKELLDSKVSSNIQKLELKKKEPSQILNLNLWIMSY